MSVVRQASTLGQAVQPLGLANAVDAVAREARTWRAGSH